MNKTTVDINTYFEYVNNIIDADKNTSINDKNFYKKMISIFKVGTIINICEYNSISQNDLDFEMELYNLFEILSKRFFKLLNYYAWRKRILFDIKIQVP